MFGLCLVHVWDKFETCLGDTICLGHVWDMLGTCLGFGTCLGYVWGSILGSRRGNTRVGLTLHPQRSCISVCRSVRAFQMDQLARGGRKRIFSFVCHGIVFRRLEDP